MAQLVCIDIDGTLMDTSNPEHFYIPQENINTIQKALKKGIYVCISTGRMRNSAIKVAEQVGIQNEYLICYNGAMICHGNEIVFESEINEEQLKKINKIIKENNVYAQFYIRDEYFVERKIDLTESYEKKIGVKAQEIGENVFHLNKVTKILSIAHSKEEKMKWMQLFTGIDGIVVTESQSTFIEITKSDATKGHAVKTLAKMLGIDLKDVMAIGDAMNDVPMLDVVGYPVVMGQAEDRVKEGRLVTDRCENSGVAKAIEKYCLNETTH
ncbi:Cof family hydrolase subfamily protein [Entamoeba histolytica HM-1:IMSS-B]|uniref:Uncharacterized protein n=8 Tax=Entamoeba histolytica TaxID=5759 RepID=C4M9L1_ENTH1|nr:hypothetical protein, conserved [Entamoeba histolytica HM-1:IMSS]EMD43823.1 Cof family hydrolase subfamily protein [Entamoeba histolytica KU27]EMH72512.1 Cof family hydrolase subfamily protein [Entamoeba histolytica HM-1:IMSS-B]EMS13811.1 Cof family hydrolase subfamily protein [Entamoeba histolytica HM-3:IMSS]ENY65990.1 Cof family hydrolase subfamily protein, putative [Entamoeba histolytica HM-1:IMSS-A]GAT98364.1 hypothetical protein conserved [Entamoeba histolytica]|eukprot:XP_650942.1 hypothetical protein, conserved [Entamoeba histolytica HM-1:IMSS]